MKRQSDDGSRPERVSKRVTGVTDLADLNALCESPHVDYVTLRISDDDELSELGFLSFERARALATECVRPDKLVPQFYALDQMSGRPDETGNIRRWVEQFRPDAVVASHASPEALKVYSQEGITMISDREELSSDVDEDLIGQLIEGALSKGWDLVDLYVYPEYDNGWELLLDEFPADLADLEALVSRYPIFVSVDVTRDNLGAVRDSLSGALGILFELRTDHASFRGNSNVFDLEDILELAAQL